jgi:hypothetical protein
LVKLLREHLLHFLARIDETNFSNHAQKIFKDGFANISPDLRKGV